MILFGGWSKFRVLEQDDRDIFNGVIKEDFVGSSFDPLVVSEQVVNGKMYKYICNAAMITNPSKTYLAEVVIFRPLEGEATLIEIREI